MLRTPSLFHTLPTGRSLGSTGKFEKIIAPLIVASPAVILVLIYACGAVISPAITASVALISPSTSSSPALISPSTSSYPADIVATTTLPAVISALLTLISFVVRVPPTVKFSVIEALPTKLPDLAYSSYLILRLEIVSVYFIIYIYKISEYNFNNTRIKR